MNQYLLENIKCIEKKMHFKAPLYAEEEFADIFQLLILACGQKSTFPCLSQILAEITKDWQRVADIARDYQR